MIELQPAAPETLLRHTGRLHRIYRECFAGPPWSEPETWLARYPQHVRRQLANPGAGGWLARDDGRIVGAVYGWSAPPALPRDTPFDKAVAEAAPATALPRMLAPALVVGELMVAESYRRRGIAARLLRAYVMAAPTAWLVTHRDGAAPHFYRRQGWREEAEFASEGVPMRLFTWAAAPRT
ncbi:GNAT family N-acetyltransferase [Dactylosporangium sp. AC04546]|uniref:GNAT family N-acetyltransferase n=1 Tax=Dactylosporangium sp. AC04546 TaxID=2862460 RepID=UPI001EDFEE68|nr:GNAT family N-acetyltransferase [Dactylosporangium sp. AC04546]WVK80397.1 GNAT family N-acetyltransferase [Dactylosporangium sp. AC04546]